MTLPGREHLLDILKGSVATLVLFLAFVTIPMVGLLPGIFAPLPAIVYSLKRGRLTGSAIVLITTAVLAVMGEGSTVALYLLQSGCLSIALPFFLGEGKGAGRSLAYSVAISLALMLMLGATYAATRGVNVDRQVIKGIEASITQAATLYEKAGLRGDELKMMRDGLTQAGVLIGKVYPAMMVVSLIMVAGVNLLIVARMSIRQSGFPALGSFLNFKNPEPMVWVLIAAGFSMLVPNAAVTRIGLNILIVLLFMYLIQGLAVMAQLLDRLAAPRFVRIILYVLLAVQPYLAIGVAVVGLFDIWGNFRAPRQPKNL